MSASSQDYCYSRPGGGGRPPPRKIATGRAKPKPAKSMDNLGPPAPPQVPKIDLDNFDSPEFDGLDYVLTSPRSLEACHRLGLRPVQLLYKRLQDFELENAGVPVARLFDLYDRHEAERKENLRLVRLERDRILLASAPDLPATAGASPVAASAAMVQEDRDGGRQVSWELAEHEKQAERLRQKLESQRLRRLEESKARRERERDIFAEQSRLDQREQQPSSNWEERQRQTEARRLLEDRDSAEATEALERSHLELHERAQRARSGRDAEEVWRRHLRLKRKEEAHRERSDSQRRAARREAEAAHEATLRRERAAAKNLELAQEKRQLSLKEQQLLQLERYRSSTERRKRLETEIDEYKEELRRYRQLAEQRAEETVNRRSQQLARRAAAKEAHKQAVVRRNQREQERAEEAWRRRTEAQAAAKQREAARLQEARERERQSARAVAESAARMRARVRRNSETFDRKVTQVNLVNQLGLGHEIK